MQKKKENQRSCWPLVPTDVELPAPRLTGEVQHVPLRDVDQQVQQRLQRLQLLVLLQRRQRLGLDRAAQQLAAGRGTEKGWVRREPCVSGTRVMHAVFDGTMYQKNVNTLF